MVEDGNPESVTAPVCNPQGLHGLLGGTFWMQLTHMASFPPHSALKLFKAAATYAGGKFFGPPGSEFTHFKIAATVSAAPSPEP
jgi:hypothetical protein